MVTRASEWDVRKLSRWSLLEDSGKVTQSFEKWTNTKEGACVLYFLCELDLRVNKSKLILLIIGKFSLDVFYIINEGLVTLAFLVAAKKSHERPPAS